MIVGAAVFLAGLIIGIGLSLAYQRYRQIHQNNLASRILAESQQQNRDQVEVLVRNLEGRFGDLALKALSQSTSELLKLADTQLKGEREVGSRELEGKKELIDQQLSQMNQELERVSRLMQSLEKDREEKFGQLAFQLRHTGEQTALLQQTTHLLKEALASSRARGQWGERMADDVLRMAGFIENVNYQKQKSIAGIGSTPDVTFLLPKSLKLNMDVKFPYDNYVRFLETTSESDREKSKNDFLRDVKAKIKEVTTRDYINPEQNTLDYVLLFVPNEQIYAFIHEQDPQILDAALQKHVIFCSPITLFAVLAVIRQAVDNFSVEQATGEIQSLLLKFKKQWSLFVDKLESLGKKIDSAQREFTDLNTTRRKQLERPLDRIDEIRRQRGMEDESAAPDPPLIAEIEPIR